MKTTFIIMGLLCGTLAFAKDYNAFGLFSAVTKYENSTTKSLQKIEKAFLSESGISLQNLKTTNFSLRRTIQLGILSCDQTTSWGENYRCQKSLISFLSISEISAVIQKCQNSEDYEVIAKCINTKIDDVIDYTGEYNAKEFLAKITLGQDRRVQNLMYNEFLQSNFQSELYYLNLGVKPDPEDYFMLEEDNQRLEQTYFTKRQIGSLAYRLCQFTKNDQANLDCLFGTLYFLDLSAKDVMGCYMDDDMSTQNRLICLQKEMVNL